MLRTVCVCERARIGRKVERTRSRGEKIRKVGGKGKLLTMSAWNESHVASNEPRGVEGKEETRMTNGIRWNIKARKNRRWSCVAFFQNSKIEINEESCSRKLIRLLNKLGKIKIFSGLDTVRMISKILYKLKANNNIVFTFLDKISYKFLD